MLLALRNQFGTTNQWYGNPITMRTVFQYIMAFCTHINRCQSLKTPRLDEPKNTIKYLFNDESRFHLVMYDGC